MVYLTNLTLAAGLTTHTAALPAPDGARTETATTPDGRRQITRYRNGLPFQVEEFGSDNTPGTVITYTYDEFNRPGAILQSFGGETVNTVTLTYDALDRTLTETVNGRTTVTVYDDVNRQVTVTQPGDRVTLREYHPTGELKRLEGAEDYTQEWTWDPIWGHKETLTTWQNADTPQVTTWTYNNRGFNTAKHYPDNAGPTYTYDADGNLFTRTWARGVVTSYDYDERGRLTAQTYSDDTAAIAVTYNHLDQPVTVTDASGTRSFTYDANHRLANETNPYIVGLETEYTYDTFGRRIMLEHVHNGNRKVLATYGYDPQGRFDFVGNGSDTLKYEYRLGLNQLQSAQWQNSFGEIINERTYHYDNYHRLTEISLNGFREVSYTINDRDERFEASFTNAHWTYQYDDLGQVIEANGPQSYEYSYDGIGNRLESKEGSSVFNYSTNLLNQYTLINRDVPQYDADGNMIGDGKGWVYSFNGENRLIRAENSDTLVEMNYDYMGRRFEKKVYRKGLFTFYNWNAESSEYFSYNGYKLVAIYNEGTGDQTHVFTWQPTNLDVPVSLEYGGQTYYYITDGNKNVTSLIDTNGTKVATYTYGPFGQIISQSGSLAEINPFRFSSEFQDEDNGLIYYNFRYYNSNIGRWMSRDPIGENGCVNIYVLNRNDSLNKWDVNGLVPLGLKLWDMYFSRAARGLTTPGRLINLATSQKKFEFIDSESELVHSNLSNLKSNIHNALVKDALKKGVSPYWKRNFMDRQKITRSRIDHYGIQEAGYLLHGAHANFASGSYNVRCEGNKLIFSNLAIRYEWHDQIDANSHYENWKRIYNGDVMDALKGYILGEPGQFIEAFIDTSIDKGLGASYYCEIFGIYVTNDVTFSVEMNHEN